MPFLSGKSLEFFEWPLSVETIILYWACISTGIIVGVFGIGSKDWGSIPVRVLPNI